MPHATDVGQESPDHPYHPLCGCSKCFGTLPAQPGTPPLSPILADRDRIWCTALLNALDIDGVGRVLAEFNRLRRD
jgi:hypothetical protein